MSNNDYAIQKISSYVDNINKLNYKETPVDILTYLRDDYFIGKSTNNGKAIFPGWFDPIQEIFYNDNKYIVVLTGAIGTGKSTVAIYCMSYILYRIYCLKNPHLFFKLAGTDKFAVSFFNLTKTLGDSRGFQKLQNLLTISPWFQEHGGIIKGKGEKYMDLPLYSWKMSSPYSKGYGIVGEDVLLGIMDEVDDPTASMGQKQRVLKTYEATVRRFESRFVYDTESVSRFFLVSSKNDDLAFLDTFIEEMKTSDRILVIDKAQWEIKPKSFYSGKKFGVLVGDAYTPSKILEDFEVNQMTAESKNVIFVPIEFKFDFDRDIIGALRDFAGVSVRGIRKYKLIPSERFITDCFDTTKRNPFKSETIEIGLKDDIELIALCDVSAIRSKKSDFHYIHMDISFSQDCLGLAMSSIIGWTTREVEQPDGTFIPDAVPVVETDFCVRFRARQDDRIPLHKIRKFILDLRGKGIAIKMFSADLALASEDTTQILTAAGIECEYFSLDKSVKPYMDFRNMIFERRWICHKSNVLFFELKHIEHNRDEGKIDHPEKVKDTDVLDDGTIRSYVTEGSKDIADAVAGSVSQAVKYALKPFDVEDAVKALTERRKSEKPMGGFEGDWYIDTGQTDDKGQKVKALIKENDQVQAMVEALKKFKQKKPIL
jgi:hypothetical protein